MFRRKTRGGHEPWSGTQLQPDDPVESVRLVTDADEGALDVPAFIRKASVQLVEEMAQVPSVRWSSQEPPEPGWYWMRDRLFGVERYYVHLSASQNGLVIDHSDGRLARCQPVDWLLS